MGTVWLFDIAIENCHLWWVFPSKMVIFHSYVSLPEGNGYMNGISKQDDINVCLWNLETQLQMAILVGKMMIVQWS